MWHAAVVEQQLACAAGADAELVFFSSDLEAGEARLHQEGGDAPVARLRVGVGEQKKQPGLAGVADPQLPATEQEVVALVHRNRGQSKGVATGAGF